MTNQTGYTKEKETISLVWANIFSVLLIIPVGLLYAAPFFLLWGFEEPFKRPLLGSGELSGPLFILAPFLLFFIFLLGIVIHELLHGAVFAFFAKNGFKSIKWGVLWKVLTPYCHCKEPLKISHYVLGALAPTIVLGVFPAVLALFTGNFTLLFFAILFTLGGAGDILLVYSVRKEKKGTLIEDLASEPGYYVYRPVER